jgi:hypothetical protein
MERRQTGSVSQTCAASPATDFWRRSPSLEKAFQVEQSQRQSGLKIADGRDIRRNTTHADHRYLRINTIGIGRLYDAARPALCDRTQRRPFIFERMERQYDIAQKRSARRR